jgi:hypothetical protein
MVPPPEQASMRLVKKYQPPKAGIRMGGPVARSMLMRKERPVSLANPFADD